MSTLALTRQTPSIPQGLTAQRASKAISLSWTANLDTSDEYEVFKNTTSDSGTATKIATVKSNTFVDANVAAASTNYYWVKAKNVFGVTSAFSTGSGLIIGLALKPSDMASPTAISTGTFSSTNGGGSGTVSTYDTWFEAAYLVFTAGTNTKYTMSAYSAAVMSSTAVASGQELHLRSRTRLINTTLSATVVGSIKETTHYVETPSNSYGVLNPLVSVNESVYAGFLGELIPGNSYRFVIEWSKVRQAGTPTANLTVSTSSITSTAAATTTY